MAVSMDICSWQAPTIPVWTLCWVLSIPHFLYAILWLRPDVWQNFFGKASLTYIANCGYICKGAATLSGGASTGYGADPSSRAPRHSPDALRNAYLLCNCSMHDVQPPCGLVIMWQGGAMRTATLVQPASQHGGSRGAGLAIGSCMKHARLDRPARSPHRPSRRSYRLLLACQCHRASNRRTSRARAATQPAAPSSI